jgi:type I restriction enzyme S subunit
MQSNSTGIRNLDGDAYKAIEVKFPTLAEQKRIVQKLDEALAGISKAKETAVKNLQNARALFESQLEADLTKRGPGWIEKPFDEVCHKITDGTHHSPKKQFTERAPGTFP